MKKYVVLILLLFAGVVFARTVTHFYATWDVIEMDTCASAWLIKTFIDKKAVFKFYPKGEIIEEGIAFDTPDAELRRTAAASTFEAILAKYKINDPCLLEIGAMIHDVEINYWADKQKESSQRLNEEIITIIKNSHSPQECLQKSFPVFDALYAELKAS